MMNYIYEFCVAWCVAPVFPKPLLKSVYVVHAELHIRIYYGGLIFCKTVESRVTNFLVYMAFSWKRPIRGSG